MELDFFGVAMRERRWGLFIMKADSMISLLARFVSFDKGMLSFIFLPVHMLTLSFVLSDM